MDEREVDRVPDDVWHTAMGMFSDVHYEQTAIYGAGQRGEGSSHILLKRDGIPFGGARVGLYLVPWIGRGMALVRFAPFWRSVGGTPDPDPYKKVIGALLDEYCRRRKLYLVIRPRPHPDFYPIEAQALGELGLEESASSMLDRYFVDATLDEAEQQKSLDQRWRYNLRKGLAHGLEVRIGDAPADIKTFQDIYAEMVRRKNLNYPGVDLPASIPDLMRLPERMKMRIALAHHEGKPIGGIAFSVVGDLAYYVFGATSDEATALNAGYVLQWHVMSWLRENTRVRWYELGGPGDPGIRQFRKGLAGKRGVLLAVREFHYCPDVTARVVVGGLFALRDVRNRIQRWQRERKPSEGRRSNRRGEKMKQRKFMAGILAVSFALSSAAAMAQADMVKGEVKKIDESAGKVTLKHGPIKNLDMDEDGMTMVFRVQDPAMLKKVKVGDKVQFQAERATAGITITKIEKQK